MQHFPDFQRPASGPGALGISRKDNATAPDASSKARREFRRHANELRRVGGYLLRNRDERFSKRMSGCGQVNFDSVTVVRRTAPDGTRRASVSGLTTCGSVWACPVCGPKIAERRRVELNSALSWMRSEGLSPVLLTLTFRHKRSDDLRELLQKLVDARKAFFRSMKFRKLGIAQYVIALEITHGRNGFHPHLHCIVAVPGANAVRQVESLRALWLAKLEGQGLSGNSAAFQCQDGSVAGDYVAKWGAAEELTLANHKAARASGSRTPLQLLADAAEGDKVAAAAWIEFAAVSRGRRALTWSTGDRRTGRKGLRELAGLTDVSDETVSAEGEVSEVVRFYPSAVWRLVRSRLCSILDAAETGDIADILAAEIGPSDCEVWRRSRAGPVFDPEPVQ